MSGSESNVVNETSGAIILGILFFAIGMLSRALVTKIKQVLAVSSSIGTLITVFVFVLGWRDQSLYDITGYFVIWIYSTVLAQIGNTVTGLTIRFLTWFKNDYL